MKSLIAISSCARDLERCYHEAIRKTWVADLRGEFDYRFFLGDIDRETEADEIILPKVPDDYHNLPLKTRESLRWALDMGYDYVFRAFTDTCIHPQRLLACGYERYVYFGNFGTTELEKKREGYWPWASGGAGYFLKRPAIEKIIVEDPDDWAEDRWVAQILVKHGIWGFHSDNFLRVYRTPPGAVTVHLSKTTGVYEPSWMVECYKKLRAS
jgi:hypothetical protein